MIRQLQQLLAALLAVGLLMATACSKEPDYANDSTQAVVQFQLSRQSYGDTPTRVAASGFENGDSVDLWSNDGNGWQCHSITYTDGEWLPALRWADLGSGSVQLVALYPASNTTPPDTARSFTLPQDQHDQANYQAADPMSATATVTAGNRVVLSFNHWMSRVEVTLSDTKGQPLSGEQWQVEVNTHATTSVVPATQSITLATPYTLQWVTAHPTSSATYETLVAPQPMADFQTTATGWIRVSHNGKSAIYTAPLQIGSVDFENTRSGYQVQMQLTVRETDEQWANTTKFVYGVTAPPTDTDWLWGYSWHEGYGWFDCNKLEPTPEGIDGNMCWAATASNLIHWWIKNNREQIARYEVKAGHTWGPRKFNSPDDSEVFTWFRSKYSNTGGQIAMAVNYYLIGLYQSDDYRAHYEGTPDRNQAAYAGDILGLTGLTERIGRSGTYPLSKEEFNDGIRRALTNNRAIGFSIPQHAITMWGADFDATGTVCGIYTVDNNDPGEGLLYHFSIFYNSNGTYMSNSYGTSKAIVQLVLLDLGRDLWANYLGE